MKRVYIVKHEGRASKGLVSVQETKTARMKYQDHKGFKQACKDALGAPGGQC